MKLLTLASLLALSLTACLKDKTAEVAPQDPAVVEQPAPTDVPPPVEPGVAPTETK